jgi:7,8-dihydropterin-6-yl-methyl-4-(beta-D-ribofuranosyl)aminobenzene 5'-phosphate synthase
MKTTINILCDNSISRSGFIGEHGFSALIERGQEKYLFDTGPGMSLPLNLKALDKNLKGLKKVFLSHGHYDHTGGLKWVLEQTGKIEVIAHPAVFSGHLNADPRKPTEFPRYIGCPFTREELEDLGAAFTFLDRTQETDSGIWFLSGIDRDPEKLPEDTRLVLKQPQGLVPDPLIDDASLLLNTETSPVLILGCAHTGILNILDYVQNAMHITTLRAILGGTHLMFYGPEVLDQAIKRFEDFAVDLIAVSHCTGMNAAIRLANHFGDRFMLASAGTVFTF